MDPTGHQRSFTSSCISTDSIAWIQQDTKDLLLMSTHLALSFRTASKALVREARCATSSDDRGVSCELFREVEVMFSRSNLKIQTKRLLLV
jgi:hypothetical protein